MPRANPIDAIRRPWRNLKSRCPSNPLSSSRHDGRHLFRRHSRSQCPAEEARILDSRTGARFRRAAGKARPPLQRAGAAADQGGRSTARRKWTTNSSASASAGLCRAFRSAPKICWHSPAIPPPGARSPMPRRSSTKPRPCSQKLDKTGAVLIGKLAMVELAGGGGLPDRRRLAVRAGPESLGHAAGPADRPAARPAPWRPDWCRSRWARRHPAPSSLPPLSAASPDCGPPTGWSAATAPWRSPGRWTRSARCAAAPKTAGWSAGDRRRRLKRSRLGRTRAFTTRRNTRGS